MVALLSRLKFRLWWTGYRQDPKRWIATGIGVITTLPVIVMIAIGLGVLAYEMPQLLPPVITILGTVAMLAWAVIPLLAFGVDDTLAASKFSLFPLRARQLQPGLFVAAMISIPAVLMLLGGLAVIVPAEIALARSVAGPTGIVAMIVLPVFVAVGVGLCFLWPRAAVTSASVGGVSRRRREVGGLITIVGGIGLFYAFQILLTSEAERLAELDAEAVLGRVAYLIGWTPFGAPFAASFDLAAGHWATFAARLVITAVTVTLLWMWWHRGIRESLVTGAQQGNDAPRYRQRARFVPWFYPKSPLGAVAARSLRYWRRDMRYLVGVLMMPIVGLFLIALSVVNDTPWLALLAPLIASWGVLPVMNDFGYDGPAMWVNTTHGVEARTNLRGRALAALTVLGPLLLILVVGAVVVSGQPQYGWPLLGGGFGLLLVGLGIAAPVSVLLPYRMKAPGGNMFSSGSGGGVNAFLSAMIGMLGIFLPLLPAMAVYVVGLWTPWVMQVAPLVALATGVGVLFLGWHLGAKVLTRREPEVFATVRDWID